MLEEEYREKLISAGFTNIEIVRTRTYEFSQEQADVLLSELSEPERKSLSGSLVSAFIRAKKPTDKLVVDTDYTIRTARESDLSAIDKLLSDSGLTNVGVRENLSNFLVAECEDIVGVIGIEFAGHGVMLRSMAISQELRKRGIGAALFNRCLEIARAAGSKDAYLLTNTAEKFVVRWGFHKIQRSEIPNELIQSSMLNNFCPTSSSCMKLEL
ncbi:N-acetylglutamate synthase, GNAT family [Propionispira arboris]|uniref:N-acetylglutamate synthase, GNAT family n=1 Tax=Propionispira arboris TaxID=84035 RepID=A0A1H6YYB2_9FIRM|nr:GNAT family N-acetyltransferase [Propionispira arboris]SEJ42372.1 N-acetylglutamate synthase, GNAT family [Propionispira arboris]